MMPSGTMGHILFIVFSVLKICSINSKRGRSAFFKKDAQNYINSYATAVHLYVSGERFLHTEMLGVAVYEPSVNASRNKNTRRRLGHMWRGRGAEGSGRHCHLQPSRKPQPTVTHTHTHIDGSPPAHLRGPDRRRGRSGLRALHRPQLLLQEEDVATAGGILHHQRGRDHSKSCLCSFVLFQARCEVITGLLSGEMIK